MAGTKRAKSRTAKRVATPPKRAATVGKKPKATARAVRRVAVSPARSKKSVAAPLLATAPKKIGKVTSKTTAAVKPAAPYQPKSEVAPLAQAPRAAATPAFDPLALARPWMRLGLQMTMSNLALQAGMVRSVMNHPPAAVAMRQGSAAYKAWLAMLGRAQPAKG